MTDLKSLNRIIPQLSMRVKLAILASIITFCSLIVVVQLAAFYLEDELTARVQESNLQTARSIRNKIVLLLESLAIHSDQVLSFSRGSRRSAFDAMSDKNVLIIGRAASPSGRILSQIGRKDFSKIHGKDFIKRLRTHIRDLSTRKLVLRGINGAAKDTKNNLLLAVFPDNLGTVRFVLLDVRGLLPNAYPYTDTFILDKSGHILLERSGKKLPDSAIRMVRDRPVNNMQFRFRHKGLAYLGAFAGDPVVGLRIITTIPENKAFEPIARLKRRGTLITFFVTGTVILVTLFFTWRMTKPLARLTHAASRIEKGDYSVELEERGRDEVGVLTGAFISMAEGIKSNEDAIRHHALHDPLTGLANRTVLRENLPGLLAMSRRESQKLAVIYIDFDRFKNINDSMGHDAGDVVLKEIALRLRDALWDCDTIARLGGDEFIVITPGLKAERNAMLIADKIMGVFMDTIPVHGHNVHLSASLGIALYPEDGIGAETLVRNADMAMYSAKREGGSTYVFYTDKLNTQAARRLKLEALLHSALEEKQFQLYFQPRVSVADGITGLEALARWPHPEQGMISPGEFIPLSEETGLIVPLGEWVMATACENALKFQSEAQRNLMMAVNVSPRQFRMSDFPDRVVRLLEDSGMKPELLEIEITEGALIEDAVRARSMLEQLKSLGVTVAIDDFGTGYSSLAYLKQLPLDILKIDRTFVTGIPYNDRDVAILNSVIALAQGLGLRTIAEGVETREQADFLIREGCDELQGFYFYKPMPANELTSLLINPVSMKSPGI